MYQFTAVRRYLLYYCFFYLHFFI